MSATRVKVTLILFGLLVGCAHGQAIPPGKYVSGDGVESVTVSGAMISFSIRLSESPSEALLERQYKLYVAPDGRIQPHPLTSSEAALGVGRFDWWWNGEDIVREDPRTGSAEHFVLSRASR